MKYELITGSQAIVRYLNTFDGQFVESDLVKILSPIYGEDEVIECIEYLIKVNSITRISPNGQVMLSTTF